jgi:hypothetical protein
LQVNVNSDTARRKLGAADPVGPAASVPGPTDLASAIDYIAEQVRVDSRLFAEYDLSGRSIKMHRARVRAGLGFREPTVEDEDRLAGGLPTRSALSS